MNTLPGKSPAAIEARFRALGQLYTLGMSLRSARRIGPVEAGAEQATPRKNISKRILGARGVQPEERESMVIFDHTRQVPATDWLRSFGIPRESEFPG